MKSYDKEQGNPLGVEGEEMGNTVILLQQIGIMFFYMIIGLALFRANLVTLEGSGSLASLLLYIVLPSAVLNSFCVERTAERIQLLLVSAAGAAAVLLVMMVAASVIYRRRPLDKLGVAFSNAGFMGLPLVTALMGEQAVFCAAALVAMMGALQWTWGQYVLSGNRADLRPAKVLKNPLVLAMAGGAAIFLLGIPVPQMAKTALSSLAALNAPLAMILLGIYLGQTDLRRTFTDPHLYLASAVRLVVIPLFTLLVLQLVPDGYELVYQTLFVSCTAPAACNVAVYAKKLGADYTYAVGMVCLSTLLALITMPLWMLLA